MTSSKKARFAHLRNIHPTIKPGDTVRLVAGPSAKLYGFEMGCLVRVLWTHQQAGGIFGQEPDTIIHVRIPRSNGETFDTNVSEGCIEGL